MVHSLKTSAAILVEQNASLQFWDLEIPELKPGQVLVDVAYSGLCHSQLNEISSAKGPDPYLPHTLGHEGSGVVRAVGENVTKVNVGDHVVLSWIKGTGQDVPGCVYNSKRGPVNSGAISTFLQTAVISENRIIPIPKEMPLREAALLGCALPTGGGVVLNEMALQEGESFGVFGVGGVGLSALLAAKMAGAYPRIAVDVHEEKLEKARLLGATHTINAQEEEPTRAVRKMTDGKGLDYAFESAGKKVAMEQAYSSLKAPGLCVLAGNLPKGERIQIDPFDLICGKKIVGTWGGKSCIDRDVETYCSAYKEEKIDLASLITHEVPLSEINTLVEQLKRGEVGRGLIKL